jgi:hypothetical protein
MSIILIDPGVEDSAPITSGAERLADLRGKRIALLDNIKHNAEYLLDEVADRLSGDFGCQVVRVKKKTYTKVAEPHVLAQMEGCDAVVTAIGD